MAVNPYDTERAEAYQSILEAGVLAVLTWEVQGSVNQVTDVETGRMTYAVDVAAVVFPVRKTLLDVSGSPVVINIETVLFALKNGMDVGPVPGVGHKLTIGSTVLSLSDVKALRPSFGKAILYTATTKW